MSVRNIPDFSSSQETRDLRGALGVPAESLLFIHTGRLVGGRHVPEILDAFETLAHPTTWSSWGTGRSRRS